MSCAGMSLCLGRGVCRAHGSQATGFAATSGACSFHSHHPGCSASEHSSCLLITLIIENYRFSVGNVYLHPTFPKLPISITVMSHPPVCFRQHWALYLQAAWATPEERQLPPGTALACALRVLQSPQGQCSNAGSACAPYSSQYPHPLLAAWEVPAPQHRSTGDIDGCHLVHSWWLMGLSRGTMRAVYVSPVRELCFPPQPFAHS